MIRLERLGKLTSSITPEPAPSADGQARDLGEKNNKWYQVVVGDTKW